MQLDINGRIKWLLFDCISNCFSTNFDTSECKPGKLQCGDLYLLLLSSSHYHEHIHVFMYKTVQLDLLAFNGKDYCKFFLKSEYTYHIKERKLVFLLSFSLETTLVRLSHCNN